MLVLSRKLGDRVVIADSIIVTVVQVSAGKVRLGIEAPTDVPIVRSELRAPGETSTLGPRTARAGS